MKFLILHRYSTALLLLYSNSFTFLLPLGSAELPVMMAHMALGTKKVLGLNLQESLDGLHSLQSEWLIWKQRTHTSPYCGQGDRKHKPKQGKQVTCLVAT